MSASTDLLDEAVRVALAAAEPVLDVYARDFEVQSKGDGSPVTEADERAQELICARLAELLPGVPIVAEEDAESVAADSSKLTRFWLVDPLDGTKEFISRNGEFTINIALVQDGVPVLGVVLAPAIGRLFAAASGSGGFVSDTGSGSRRLGVRQVPAEGMTIVSSRSHGDADALARFTAGRPVAASITAGSSLKFCLVAAGEADFYPRFGRTMEWDTAAGDAVLRASGGIVTDLDGAVLRYGKPGFENPHFLARAA